jgi:ATP-dependent Clp protease ATP-binding subunit ClpA
VYERFTDRARKVLELAKQEAQLLSHQYIGTEHILLGLLAEGSGVAANVLKNLDIDPRTIRLEVEKIVLPAPDMVMTGNMPQTPRAKKVIEYSIEEARNLNHNYVGTEHLLLGLLREQEGVAAQVLMNLGLKLEDVREEVLRLVGRGPDSPTLPRHLLVVPIWDLPASEFPVDLREALQILDPRIEHLNQEKESAVAERDFELAAHLRDQADKLKQNRRTIIHAWRSRRPLDPSWLLWNGGTVKKMARVIRRERRWGDLPILADALEEAGCTDQEILTHCRQPGEHASGCWVVALLLDKR